MWRLRQGWLDLPEWPLHRAAFGLHTNDLRRPERRELLRDHLQCVRWQSRLRDDLSKERLGLRQRFVQGHSADVHATHLQPGRRRVLRRHWRRVRRHNRLRPAVLRWLNLRRTGLWRVWIVDRHSRPADPTAASDDALAMLATAAGSLPTAPATATAVASCAAAGEG